MNQSEYESMVESIATDVRNDPSYPDDIGQVVIEAVDSSSRRIGMDDGDVLDVLKRAEWSVADVVQIADFDEEVAGAVRYAASRQIERDVREAVNE